MNKITIQIMDCLSRVAALLNALGNLEMVGGVRCFAESFQLCVPELKSLDGNALSLGNSWEPGKSKMAAIDPGKLQNVLIFTRQHAVNIILILHF